MRDPKADAYSRVLVDRATKIIRDLEPTKAYIDTLNEGDPVPEEMAFQLEKARIEMSLLKELVEEFVVLWGPIAQQVEEFIQQN